MSNPFRAARSVGRPIAGLVGTSMSLAFSVLAATLEGCSARESDSGRSAEALLGVEAGSYVSGLALLKHTGGSPNCSGSLISSSLVLTALHCLFGTDSTGDVLL